MMQVGTCKGYPALTHIRSSDKTLFASAQLEIESQLLSPLTFKFHSSYRATTSWKCFYSLKSLPGRATYMYM